MCGIAGVVGDPNAATLAAQMIHALQHRGQEGAGITCSNGTRLMSHHGVGHVHLALPKEAINAMTGTMAVAHTRYGTFGGKGKENIQPLLAIGAKGETIVSLAHNGTLTNGHTARRRWVEAGVSFRGKTDSEAFIPELVRGIQNPEQTLIDIMREGRLIGAYALIVHLPNRVIACRDPNGIRPLVIGKLGRTTLLASEDCAIRAVGGKVDRDVEPGEVITFYPDGQKTVLSIDARTLSPCAFETVYLQSAVSDRIAERRIAMGRALAREHPAPLESIVVPVLDSASFLATGYAEESGRPYVPAIIHNRYYRGGRTFITPDQQDRAKAVAQKHIVIPGLVDGRKIVVVDDSIVRGTTMTRIVADLRAAGADSVHVRVGSPPVRNPCYHGIDTGRKNELLAHTLSVRDITQEIGADSLGFLGIESLLAEVGCPTACTACFGGAYPTPLPDLIPLT